jgi:hypothetical protein
VIAGLAGTPRAQDTLKIICPSAKNSSAPSPKITSQSRAMLPGEPSGTGGLHGAGPVRR